MKPFEKTETKRIAPRLPAPIVLTPDQIASIAGARGSLVVPHFRTTTATTGLCPTKTLVKF